VFQARTHHLEARAPQQVNDRHGLKFLEAFG
jgi:hypothetical protein